MSAPGVYIADDSCGCPIFYIDGRAQVAHLAGCPERLELAPTHYELEIEARGPWWAWPVVLAVTVLLWAALCEMGYLAVTR